MRDDTDSLYDQSLDRPAPPVFWMGLSALLGVCCVAFFLATLIETYLLMNGYALALPASASYKPAIGEIKFYVQQTANGEATGTAVTNVPTGTKTIYAYFTYKNMPKSGVTWSYSWTLNGADLAGASKDNQKWTRDGSGAFYVKLSDDKGLKPGLYELTVDVADAEQVAGFVVGP